MKAVQNRSEKEMSVMSENKKFGIKGVLRWFLYGLPMGVAHIIPGVSGGTLALIFGYYEDYIAAVKNVFRDFKNSSKRLGPLILGVGIAMFGLSHIIDPCLEHFLFPTVMLFIGAILGGMPMLIRKLKNEPVKALDLVLCVAAAVITIGLVALSTTSHSETNLNLNVGKWLLIWLASAISGAIMVVPGVSGSAFLMTVGFYGIIFGYGMANMFHGGEPLLVLLAYLLGVAVGIFLISKPIDTVLKKHEHEAYWAIIGFLVASAVVILLQNFFMMDVTAANGIDKIRTWTSIGNVLGAAGTNPTSVLQYIAGFALCALGFLGSWKMSRD